jgi:hypothetical protein
MTQLPPDDTTRTILRDRRSGRRIVTKRNVLRFVIALVLVFIGISIASEFHDEEPGEYGRLYERRTRRADVEPRKPYTVVQENNISDQVGADPMLLEAARRQQYLGVSDADLQRMREQAMGLNTSTQPAITIPAGQGILETNSDREKPRLEISGGPGGVTVEQKPPERP